MMSVDVLLDLPDSLCHDILSEWFCTDELARLDSAYCNSQQRPSILDLLDGLEVATLDGGSCKRNIMHMLSWLLARNVYCCRLTLESMRPTMSALDASLLGAYIQNVAHCLSTVCVEGNNQNVTVVLGLLAACKCCLTDLDIDVAFPVSDVALRTTLSNSSRELTRLFAYPPGKWKPRLAKDISFPVLREVAVNIACDEDLHCLCNAAPNIVVLSLCNPTCSRFGFAAVAVHCLRLEHLKIEDDGYIIDIDGAFDVIADACTSLLQLELTSCRGLSDVGLTATVSQCTKLQCLKLRDIAGITDASLVVLAHAGAHLREVHVESCRLITGAGIVAIAQHSPNVTTLNLACSRYITADNLHMALPYLKRILSLNLNHVAVDDQLLTQIAAHIPNLESLWLGTAVRRGYSLYTFAGLSTIKWKCENLHVSRLL